MRTIFLCGLVSLTACYRVGPLVSAIGPYPNGPGGQPQIQVTTCDMYFPYGSNIRLDACRKEIVPIGSARR